MTEKTLRIEREPASTLWRIKWDNGGELPPELVGAYTSPTIAQAHIDAWKAKNTRTNPTRVKS